MGELKLTGKTEKELPKQLQRVKTIGDVMHMEIGLEKYANVVFKKGKLVYSQNRIIRDISRETQQLE
jgi:hypothetical protein